MSLDASRCAELLEIRERATPGKWAAWTSGGRHGGLSGPAVTDLRIRARLEGERKLFQSEYENVCELTSGIARQKIADGDFICSAHDLADQLRDALELLAECRKLAYNLQNEHTALADLLDKLNEAGIE